jgi:hypothetical protein
MLTSVRTIWIFSIDDLHRLRAALGGQHPKAVDEEYD